jgi:class 3 adenylate cyclase
MPDLNATLGTDFQLRIGVHTGQAVAGVIGTAKFSYDVWGDTVNLASRLESTGEPGTVSVSADVVAAVADGFRFEPAGRREMKGRGQVEVYHLLGPSTVAA